MKRYQRTLLMIEHGREGAIEWGKKLANTYEITTIIEPRQGLTMIKQRETAQNSLFYSGEILVTECKVRNAHDIGVGVVVGNDYEFSYALAIIDLAYVAQWQECEAMTAWLQQLEEIHKQYTLSRSETYKRTRVDFSTMDQ